MPADTFCVSLRAPRFLWGEAIQNLTWIATAAARPRDDGAGMTHNFHYGTIGGNNDNVPNN